MYEKHSIRDGVSLSDGYLFSFLFYRKWHVKSISWKHCISLVAGRSYLSKQHIIVC